jgi:hypothetical protein
MKTLLKRTFTARNHPKDSAERKTLNEDVLTSEYMPSYKFLVREPFLMSDGSANPRQPFVNRPFTTKAEAVAYLSA